VIAPESPDEWSGGVQAQSDADMAAANVATSAASQYLGSAARRLASDASHRAAPASVV
jgi:hypothetical protein